MLEITANTVLNGIKEQQMFLKLNFKNSIIFSTNILFLSQKLLVDLNLFVFIFI